MSFKDDVVKSELSILLEKEREMKDLYSAILERVENAYVRKKVKAILKDEIKHMGYAEIIMSLLKIDEKK